MRLFVAIPLPEEVKMQLQQLQEPVDGLQWQRPDQYHLTLRFIGEVSDNMTRRVEDELNQVDTSPFDIQLTGLGYFPQSSIPKVIWAGVKKNKRLTELQSQVEQACQRAGLEPDNRSYQPHITLGRNKEASKTKLRSLLDRYRHIRADAIPVTSFNLYTSELIRKGAIHRIRRKYPFQKSG